MTIDDGRTIEHHGIRFRTVGKGILHCQTCLRITYNYVGHVTWHETGTGDIGLPATSPLEPTQPEAEALASVPVYARGGAPTGCRDCDASVEMACAWSDYRKDYGVSNDAVTRAREHEAFVAGWQAARGRLDAGGPLR